MEKSEIFEKMTEICRDVFEEESLVVTESMTAADIKNWDSLTHLTLVNETTSKVAFPIDEVTGSKSLGELLDALMKHISEK